MTEPIPAESPHPGAKVIGAVYLLYFLTAVAGAILAKGIVVSGDAAATAANLQTHEPAFRSGVAVGLISNLLYVAVTALFYQLFEPVNRTVSLLAAFVGLVGCAVQTCGGVFQLAPLVVLGSGPFSGAGTLAEGQALALLFLKLYVQAVNIALVFFACYDLLLGYLIYRSTFLPRVLGVLMIAAGVGWLSFLWPPLAATLSSYVQPLGFLSELVLMLWLLVRGVNIPRWQERIGSR